MAPGLQQGRPFQASGGARAQQCWPLDSGCRGWLGAQLSAGRSQAPSGPELQEAGGTPTCQGLHGLCLSAAPWTPRLDPAATRSACGHSSACSGLPWPAALCTPPCRSQMPKRLPRRHCRRRLVVRGIARGLTVIPPCPLGAVGQSVGANCEPGASPPGGQPHPSRGSRPALEAAASGAGAEGRPAPLGSRPCPLPWLPPSASAPPCFMGRVSRALLSVALCAGFREARGGRVSLQGMSTPPDGLALRASVSSAGPGTRSLLTERTLLPWGSAWGHALTVS